MEGRPNEIESKIEDAGLKPLNEGILRALEVVRDFKEAEDLAKGIQSEINKSAILTRLATDRFEAGLDSEYLLKEAEKLVRRSRKPSDQFIILKNILLAKYKTKASERDIYQTFLDTEFAASDVVSRRIPEEKRDELMRLAIETGLTEQAKDIADNFAKDFSKARAYRRIALSEFKEGRDPKAVLVEAERVADNINEPVDKTFALARQAESEFEVGLDYKDSLAKAKDEAGSIKNPKSKKARCLAFHSIALAEIRIGISSTDSLTAAKKAVEGIENKNEKYSALIKIALAEAKSGIDPIGTFKEAEGVIMSIEEGEMQRYALDQLAKSEAEFGLFNEAKALAGKISETENIVHGYAGKSHMPDLLIKISAEELKSKVDFKETLEKAREHAIKIHDREIKSLHLSHISEIERDAGEFDEAKRTVEMMPSRKYKSISLEKIATAEANAGLFDVAKKTTEGIPFELLRARAISAIAVAESKAGLSFAEIKTLDNKTLSGLLSQNRDDVSYALGYFRPESVETFSNELPSHINNSTALGKAEREHDKKRIFEVSSSVDNDSNDADKRALARSLQHLDYELISNQLMAKVKAEKDPSAQLRYLKTLIEIENPKGRSVATKLYVNPELNPHQKEYLLRKLIDQGYWDKELGSFLNDKLKSGTSKEEIDCIITQIIGTLNLIPDKMTYEALESVGFLKGNTLQERVTEIMSHKERFESLDRDALLELFKNDENSMKLFYLVKGGEYSYSLINDYKFEKFKLIIDKINSLEVDKKKITRFRTSLNAAGLPKKEVGYILDELKAGRFPYMEEGRTTTFNSSVEEGSEYSKYLARLQEVWNDELLKLLTASMTENKPNNMAELDSLQLEAGLLDGQGQAARRAKRFIEQFKIGDKQSQQSIQENATAMRKELIQRAKQQGNKELKEKLSTLPASEVIFEYFDTFLPDMNNIGAYSEEWKSHIREVLTGLEATESKQEGVRTKEADFDITFLDKGKDFIRAVRFADSQQCCFNSTNYIIQSNRGSADWIARLNKDPLSFVMDIKIMGAKQITGFIFGRMGTNPETNKPVVMLNGVYSQESGQVFADNLLRIIEDKFAKKIGADLIAVASKHGGRLDRAPAGYQGVGKDIRAIRAIDEETVYDDIGQVANGRFYFTNGFVKDLI